jgi:lipoate-protein ligase A
MHASRKIVASAQRKIEQAIFQHGSIKISGLAIHPAVPVGEDNSAGLNDLIAIDIERFNIHANAFRGAFERSLGVVFSECDLSAGEVKKVEMSLANVRKNNLAQRDIFKQK